MKKSVYIILAVLIAAVLTVIQALVANSIIRKNEMEVCTAVNKIKVGNIIHENDIETVKIYKGDFEGPVKACSKSDFAGKTASNDIAAGSILCMGDIDTADEGGGEMGFVALEVNGDNFNAGDIERGDIVDLYIMPDLDDVDEGLIIWLNDIFTQCGISFIPGKQPGVLIENILIGYINTATGQSAKYVSIRVPRPLDEGIAFLEQISLFEFISR